MFMNISLAGVVPNVYSLVDLIHFIALLLGVASIAVMTNVTSVSFCSVLLAVGPTSSCPTAYY